MNQEHFDMMASRTNINDHRLSLLVNSVRALNDKRVKGSIVQCGVYKGGGLAALAYHAEDRKVWGFDSWQGCRDPEEKDLQLQTGRGADHGLCKADYYQVTKFLYNDMGFRTDHVVLVKGWIEDTLPLWKQHIGTIAFLHIDVDLYKPIKFALEALYPQVSQGGLVCCDDYNYWAGCNLAVHEFVADKTVSLERPTQNGVWWFKR